MDTLLKRSLAAAIALGLGTAQAVDVQVSLSGDQEVPPVETSATGSGTITVNDDGTVSGKITTSGVEGTMAHIHLGPPGKSGPPVITLEKGADGRTWAVPAGAKLTEEQHAAFEEGNLYVNVHSAAHKPGEIRGQLKP